MLFKQRIVLQRRNSSVQIKLMKHCAEPEREII